MYMTFKGKVSNEVPQVPQVPQVPHVASSSSETSLRKDAPLCLAERSV